MKKLVILSIALASLMVVGCGKKATDYESIMKDYATTYYEKYMKGVSGVTVHQVTIEMLKNANEQIDAGFDVDKLKDCEDDSTVTITTNKDKDKIESYEYDLKCK